MGKRGEILLETVVFVILNLVFLTILVLFLMKQGSGAVLLEDSHSKQIALVLDSAEPGMKIKINMEKAMKVADKNGIDFADSVSIEGNYVRVRLSEKGGFEYPFFRDFSVEAYPSVDSNSEYNGIYILTVSR